MGEIILVLIFITIVLAAIVLWGLWNKFSRGTMGGDYTVDKEQPVRIFVPTMYFVVKDLINSIKMNSKKREKRLKRLEFITRVHNKLLSEHKTQSSGRVWEIAVKKKDLMDEAEATLEKYGAIKDAVSDPLPLFKDIPEASNTEPIFKPSDQKIIFKDNKPIAAAWKTELNAGVSKIFNTSLIYREAHYKLYRKLVKKLGKIAPISNYFGDLTIIPVFKGGEIYRRVIERNIDLLSSKEEREALKKELYTLFSFGDVDTSLIISSPTIKIGNAEHPSASLIGGMLFELMKANINKSSFIDIATLWNQSLKKPLYYNGESVDLKLDDRPSFEIINVDDKVDGEHVPTKYMLFSNETGFNNLYVSKNDISFKDELDRDIRFTLVRNKVPMIASQRQPDGTTLYLRCAAEGLDVSVMYPYNEATALEILEYKKEIAASGDRYHHGLYFEDEAGSGLWGM